MVELGINVWRFGGGVESVAGAELVAGISVVGLVYGFGSWLWVSDRVSSCGFSMGMGRGFDCGRIWFAI